MASSRFAVTPPSVVKVLSCDRTENVEPTELRNVADFLSS